MFDTAVVLILCLSITESLIIVIGNIFTIYVFWKHRTRLKRTSFLLINLAVADLLVGLVETIVLGTSKIPLQFEEQRLVKWPVYTDILTATQGTLSLASVSFLALISLERAYALIWPLRHRVSSVRNYIYSAIFVWVAATSSATATSLVAVYVSLDYVPWTVTNCSIIFLCLVIICASYFTIRKRLNRRVPDLDMVHRRQNGSEQNRKLSRTLFIVIAVSLVCWIPGVVVYCIYCVCSECLPELLLSLATSLRLANSLINPIIYSFKIPMFRQTLTRMKLCSLCKKCQHRVN